MLSQVNTMGDITTYSGTIGTYSKPGQYHYRAFARASDGSTVESPKTNFTVTP